MKSIYRIIILNDRTSFNKTININTYLMKFLSVFFLLILALSSFGLYKIFYPNAKDEKFNYLNNKFRDTTYLLEKLLNNGLIDSSMLKNYKLDSLLETENSLLPNNMPVEGIVTNGIDSKSTHTGIDIAASFDDNIFPAQKGLVIYANKFDNFGNTVIISHPNNYFTMYSHLNKIYVDQRDFVEINKAIGTIGQSGNSDGPHLHFEIWKNSTIIDPRDLIKNYKTNDVSIK